MAYSSLRPASVEEVFTLPKRQVFSQPPLSDFYLSFMLYAWFGLASCYFLCFRVQPAYFPKSHFHHRIMIVSRSCFRNRTTTRKNCRMCAFAKAPTKWLPSRPFSANLTPKSVGTSRSRSFSLAWNSVSSPRKRCSSCSSTIRTWTMPANIPSKPTGSNRRHIYMWKVIRSRLQYPTI